MCSWRPSVPFSTVPWWSVGFFLPPLLPSPNRSRWSYVWYWLDARPFPGEPTQCVWSETVQFPHGNSTSTVSWGRCRSLGILTWVWAVWPRRPSSWEAASCHRVRQVTPPGSTCPGISCASVIWVLRAKSSSAGAAVRAVSAVSQRSARSSLVTYPSWASFAISCHGILWVSKVRTDWWGFSTSSERSAGMSAGGRTSAIGSGGWVQTFRDLMVQTWAKMAKPFWQYDSDNTKCSRNNRNGKLLRFQRKAKSKAAPSPFFTQC